MCLSIVAGNYGNEKQIPPAEKCCQVITAIFSERRSLYAIARPSVVCLSVTFVCCTQAVQIFSNISTALGTLATH